MDMRSPDGEPVRHAPVAYIKRCLQVQKQCMRAGRNKQHNAKPENTITGQIMLTVHPAAIAPVPEMQTLVRRAVRYHAPAAQMDRTQGQHLPADAIKHVVGRPYLVALQQLSATRYIILAVRIQHVHIT